MVSDDLLFNLFPPFPPLPHGSKSNRLMKIYISTRKSSPSERTFIPVWINDLVHLLLNCMLTNNISANKSPHMVVPFFWFIYIDKHNVTIGILKGDKQKNKISSIKEIIKLDATPNLF